MSEGSPGLKLRGSIENSCIAVPGAPFPLAMRLIESFGFPAAYLSGAAFSAGQLGLPDVGLFTLAELIEQTKRLTRVCETPIIVDADTGFPDAEQVAQTIVGLEQAGAAAIQLEDQVSAKRCGHLSGKQLVAPEAMAEKIRTAVATRSDPHLVIIARTDARGVDGLDAALDRARLYLQAGADWIFIEALENQSEFADVANQLDVPLVANMTEFGKSPLLNLNELGEMGYAAVLFPVTLLRVAMRAMEAVLATIGEEGTQSSLLDLMQTREELYELLSYEEYEESDRRFFRENKDHE